jgi:hypothetical protein
MTTHLSMRLLTLTVIAPSLALSPVMTSAPAQGLSPVAATALHARVEPSLRSLRAGRVGVPAPFGAHERAELRAAEQRSSATLGEMRAGEMTNNEWTWLAIGAGIVLLIVLL